MQWSWNYTEERKQRWDLLSHPLAEHTKKDLFLMSRTELNNHRSFALQDRTTATAAIAAWRCTITTALGWRIASVPATVCFTCYSSLPLLFIFWWPWSPTLPVLVALFRYLQVNLRNGSHILIYFSDIDRSGPSGARHCSHHLLGAATGTGWVPAGSATGLFLTGSHYPLGFSQEHSSSKAGVQPPGKGTSWLTLEEDDEWGPLRR